MLNGFRIIPKGNDHSMYKAFARARFFFRFYLALTNVQVLLYLLN